MKKNLSFLPMALLLIAFGLPSYASASTEQVLHAFTGGSDGIQPEGRLVLDSAGNLYGTSSSGGANNAGVIFKLTPTSSGPWQESILYQFTGGRDGANPRGLAFDSAGNLYGIAVNGGTPTVGVPDCKRYGCGTIFKLSSTQGGWKFQLLHTFTGAFDGALPQGITLNAAGDVFVTTYSSYPNQGTIFELSSSSGVLKGSVVHVFIEATGDGALPIRPVVIDSAGNLFGAAWFGGRLGQGAVYEVSPTATGQWTESVINSFNTTLGSEPYTSLVFDSAGNLFGTTTSGGEFDLGTVFELSPSSTGQWTETLIVSFQNASDGGIPHDGMAIDASGNLYGVTLNGGLCYNCGTVFKLSPSSGGGWGFDTLYSFTGTSDGADPLAGVTLDSAGDVFGTTVLGGNVTTACPSGCGVVYEIPAVTAGVK
jgi:uncharacterized repeat protein (TIGR03803 family)